VRGISTINGNSPLYVVDGLPVNDINYLNPKDIATLTVLKDAASAAIYGSRAANGVVLITTKAGTVSAPVITVDATYGVSSPTRLPKMASASEYQLGQPGRVPQPRPVHPNHQLVGPD
jgi:TonB-dependent SusC/RagA subfamily outer membrane receptor